MWCKWSQAPLLDKYGTWSLRSSCSCKWYKYISYINICVSFIDGHSYLLKHIFIKRLFVKTMSETSYLTGDGGAVDQSTAGGHKSVDIPDLKKIHSNLLRSVFFLFILQGTTAGVSEFVPGWWAVLWTGTVTLKTYAAGLHGHENAPAASAQTFTGGKKNQKSTIIVSFKKNNYV